MDQQLKDSLILNLSVDEIDSVCDDLKLFHKGYKFFYAVDSYDFVHFFMPYLQKMKLDKSRLNRMAQEKIAYESFFSNGNGGKDSIIVLDEYKKELLSIRDLFLTRVKAAVELTNNIDTLAKELLSLFDKGGDPIELINKNFELFFLSLVYTSRKEDLKDISFVKFLKKTVHINQFETKDEDFNILADQLFRKDEISGFVEFVYDKFVEKSFDFLSRYDNSKLQRYLENTYYDIEALQRIMSANEKISKDDKHKKTIFYYLSSAPYKSKVLADIISEKYTETFTFLRRFNSSNKTIHRNIFQYFLFYKFSRNQELSLGKALEYLDFIKTEIREKKHYFDTAYMSNQKAEAFIYLQIKTRNVSLLSEIENDFYHSLIDNYRQTLKRIVKDAEGTDSAQQSIMNPFTEYLKYQFIDLEYSKAKYEHNKSILTLLKHETNLFSTIRIKFPKKNIDIIQFHFHHLPYLPFIFDGEALTNYHPLYMAMREISNIENDEESNGKVILSFLKELLSTRVKNIKEIPFEFLFLGYMDLLTIKAVPGSENQEKEFIDTLKFRLKILRSLSKYEKYGNNPQNNSSVINEIIYLLLWLFRRNGFHHKVIEFESYITELKFKDPRLFHGLALGYISDFHNCKEQDSVCIEKTRKAIYFLKIANEAYVEVLSKSNSIIIKELIIKNLIGVCNSICDSCNAIYNYKSDMEYVEEGKIYMSKIHEHIKSLHLNYDLFPILNNTEGELLCNCADVALIYYNNVEAAKKFLEGAYNKYSISERKVSMMNKKFTENLQNKLLQMDIKIASFQKNSSN